MGRIVNRSGEDYLPPHEGNATELDPRQNALLQTLTPDGINAAGEFVPFAVEHPELWNFWVSAGKERAFGIMADILEEKYQHMPLELDCVETLRWMERFSIYPFIERHQHTLHKAGFAGQKDFGTLPNDFFNTTTFSSNRRYAVSGVAALDIRALVHLISRWFNQIRRRSFGELLTKGLDDAPIPRMDYAVMFRWLSCDNPHIARDFYFKGANVKDMAGACLWLYDHDVRLSQRDDYVYDDEDGAEAHDWSYWVSTDKWEADLGTNWFPFALERCSKYKGFNPNLNHNLHNLGAGI